MTDVTETSDATGASGAAAHVTQSAARYLEAIFYIHQEGEVVRANRLADWLGVSAPTVTEATRKLVRDGLLTVGPGRALLLTAAGLAAAESIVRRHRVAEVWFFELGFDWEAADEEAHQTSFAMSDR